MDLLDKVEQLELAADQLGFRWENTDQIMSQIHSECLEIEEHLHQDDATIDKEALQEEIGDLLHAVFSLTVFCKLNPQDTLQKTLLKFERRMMAVKQITVERGLDNLEGYTFTELMHVWDEAKQLVG